MNDNEFPTAEQFATAIVAAAKLTGEDPVLIAEGEPDKKARQIAMAALHDAFPGAPQVRLAMGLGYPVPETGAAFVNRSRKSGWWREEWVDEVLGAVVGDRYGEQAL